MLILQLNKFYCSNPALQPSRTPLTVVIHLCGEVRVKKVLFLLFRFLQKNNDQHFL